MTLDCLNLSNYIYFDELIDIEIANEWLLFS